MKTEREIEQEVTVKIEPETSLNVSMRKMEESCMSDVTEENKGTCM